MLESFSHERKRAPAAAQDRRKRESRESAGRSDRQSELSLRRSPLDLADLLQFVRETLVNVGIWRAAGAPHWRTPQETTWPSTGEPGRLPGNGPGSELGRWVWGIAIERIAPLRLLPIRTGDVRSPAGDCGIPNCPRFSVRAHSDSWPMIRGAPGESRLVSSPYRTGGRG